MYGEKKQTWSYRPALGRSEEHTPSISAASACQGTDHDALTTEARSKLLRFHRRMQAIIEMLRTLIVQYAASSENRDTREIQRDYRQQLAVRVVRLFGMDDDAQSSGLSQGKDLFTKPSQVAHRITAV